MGALPLYSNEPKNVGIWSDWKQEIDKSLWYFYIQQFCWTSSWENVRIVEQSTYARTCVRYMAVTLTSNGRIFVNDEVVLACFEMLSQNFHIWAGKLWLISELKDLRGLSRACDDVNYESGVLTTYHSVSRKNHDALIVNSERAIAEFLSRNRTKHEVGKETWEVKSGRASLACYIRFFTRTVCACKSW